MQLTNSEKSDLQILQNKLDELYLKKPEGAFIKMGRGGRKMHILLLLIRKKREMPLNPYWLTFRNAETELWLPVSFYSYLYSSAFSAHDVNSFFDHTKNFIPHIGTEFAQICDADITREPDKAVTKLYLNKSPVLEGLRPICIDIFGIH